MRTHRGFTLIELLVVVTIIAILLMMLMPTMGMAREMARQSVCLSNHSLMVKALITYDSEHGAFPYNYYTYGQPQRWALGELSPYLPGGQQGVTNLRNLDEGEFPGCYVCPSADLDEIYLFNPSDKYHACYWTNVAIRCNRGWGSLFNRYTGDGLPPGDDSRGADGGGSGGEARIHKLDKGPCDTGWRSVYLPRSSSIPIPTQTVFTGDTNNAAVLYNLDKNGGLILTGYDGNGKPVYDPTYHASVPGEWHTRPGWGWIDSHLGYDRHRFRLLMSYLDGTARAVPRPQLVNTFSLWNANNGAADLTGDFMLQFPQSMECGGSGVHKLPEPLME